MCMYKVYIYIPVHIQSTCILYTSNIHQYNSGGNTQSCSKKILHQLRGVEKNGIVLWQVGWKLNRRGLWITCDVSMSPRVDMACHGNASLMVFYDPAAWILKAKKARHSWEQVDDCWCLVTFDDVWWCLMLPQLSHCPTTEWTNNGNNHGSTILKYTDFNL